MGFISVAPVCLLRANNWRRVVSGIVCMGHQTYSVHVLHNPFD